MKKRRILILLLVGFVGFMTAQTSFAKTPGGEECKVKGSLESCTTYYKKQAKCKGSYQMIKKQRVRVGVWSCYRKDGTLSLKLTFVKGKKHGPQYSYYATPKPVVYSITYYTHGVLNRYDGFYSTGVKRDFYTVLGGKMHGSRTTYHPNGTKKTEETYSKGLRHGKYTSWRANGTKKYELFFVNGKKHGVQYSFFGTKKPVIYSKTYYNMNVLYKYEGYYSSGKKREFYTVKNGMLHGNRTIFYTNSQKQSDCNYAQGVKHGMCREFDASGKLVNEQEYYMGTPINPVFTAVGFHKLSGRVCLQEAMICTADKMKKSTWRVHYTSNHANKSWATHPFCVAYQECMSRSMFAVKSSPFSPVTLASTVRTCMQKYVHFSKLSTTEKTHMVNLEKLLWSRTLTGKAVKVWCPPNDNVVAKWIHYGYNK